MKVTYLGTTVLLFDDGVNQILFDAQVSRPAAHKVFFQKIQSDEKAVLDLINIYDMHRVRAIFASHSHFDHVLDLAAFANMCDCDVYGSASSLNVARGGRVKEEQLHLFESNETVRIGDFRVQVLRSVHSKTHWYNNDLGDVIAKPIIQPAKRSAFKEGGSYDFFVCHSGKSYLIRPSFNYLSGELDGIKADVLFAGITGLAKESMEMKNEFYDETIVRTEVKTVIPIHWDNFFSPINDPMGGQWFHRMEQMELSLEELNKYCNTNNIKMIKMNPLESIDL